MLRVVATVEPVTSVRGAVLVATVLLLDVATLPEAVAGGLFTAEPLVLAATDERLALVHSTVWNGIATFFSPMPRKPPTPITTALAFPVRSRITSLTSPIFSLFAP